MGVLLVIGIVGAVALLGTADWLLKLRMRLRRRQAMSERLAAATVRMERQQEQHEEAEQAREALTSYMPAIQRDGHAATGLHPHPQRKAGRDRSAPHRRDTRRRASRAADAASRDSGALSRHRRP